MNTAKVKANRPKGCFKGFGTFELTYPNSLYGVMEPREFETTLRTLNSKCETKMPKSYLLFLLPILLGFILIIAGFVKVANSASNISNSATISASSNGISMSASSSSNSISSSSSSFSSSSFSSSFTNSFTSGFSMDRNIDDSSMNFNVDVKKSSAGPALIGIGFTLFILGSIGFCVAMFIFNNSVTKKIKQELQIINDHYVSRRIKFTLETEEISELVDPMEYDTHKNNKAYMNSITYDVHGRPIKKTIVYFILITFPAQSNQNFQNIGPNISMSDF